MSLRSEMLYYLNVLYKYSQLQIHLSSEVTRSSMRSPQKYTTVMWQERTPNSQKPEQIQEPYRGVSSVCFKWNTFQMGKRHQLSLPAPLWCQNIFQLPETDISTLIPYFMQHFACWGEKLSQTQFSDTLNWYMSLQCNTLQLQERLSSTVHLYPHLNSYPSCSLMWLELSTLPLSVSVRNGKNGLCLYSTFLAYWPLETLYNTCHTHTHTHTHTCSFTAGRGYRCRAPTCASAITTHMHTHTPGAIGCKNWDSDFAHGILDSRGQGSTLRLV